MAVAVDTETRFRPKMATRIHTGSHSPQVRMVSTRCSPWLGPAETDTAVAAAADPGTTTVCAYCGWPWYPYPDVGGDCATWVWAPHCAPSNHRY